MRLSICHPEKYFKTIPRKPCFQPHFVIEIFEMKADSHDKKAGRDKENSKMIRFTPETKRQTKNIYQTLQKML